MLLALPEPSSSANAWGVEEFAAAEILSATGLDGFAERRVSRAGRTGAFELVSEASSLLRGTPVDACLLVASDTYLSEDRLVELDDARRLRSDRCPDGFLPGEASVSLLLETPERARARSARVHAIVDGFGTGDEPNSSGSDRQSTGTGLCRAIDAACSTADAPGWVGCDLNGESYRAFEWGMALARLGARLGQVTNLTHPADCIGDVGAVSGAMLLGLVAWHFTSRSAPASSALLWCASDGPQRVALRVRAP